MSMNENIINPLEYYNKQFTVNEKNYDLTQV